MVFQDRRAGAPFLGYSQQGVKQRDTGTRRIEGLPPHNSLSMLSPLVLARLIKHLCAQLLARSREICFIDVTS
jgi:hypothetical protein